MNTKRWMILGGTLVLVITLFVFTAAYYASFISGTGSVKAGQIILNLTGKDENTQSFSLANGDYLMPGDSGKITIGLDASGSTSDIYTTVKIIKNTVPNNLKFYFDENYQFQFNKYFTIIEKENLTQSLDIYWYWDGSVDDENDSLFIGKEVNISIEADITQLQYAYMKNGSSTGEAFWSDNYKNNIKSVTFKTSTMNMPEECTEANLCFDITEGTGNKVYAYLTENGEGYNLYIVANAMIFAPSDSSNLLSFGPNLTTINFNHSFITTNVTNMSGMFKNNTSLTGIDASVLDTTNVTDMSYMFDGCSSLTVLDVSTMYTKNVENISYMFNNCSNLNLLNVNNFSFNYLNTSTNMFDGVGTSLSFNTVVKVNSKNDAKFVLNNNSNWNYGNVYMHNPNDCNN